VRIHNKRLARLVLEIHWFFPHSLLVITLKKDIN
jgi:hypothetical protein